ncbi:HAMP domain-containing protein [Saccharopolyspora rhizosphaerae]|uniref:histidine kinase n=1 Tax=Saccharopolyspora rhizosphaerae TaxID=2492662 RepID=A0A3R8NV70_9PSEU|nr:ATP-binding protein [Saccharopolyspora rhizosphaerae]RRO13798.1 HAMP domain-containing protein [Saccharopolyspora rhizosphaerae]
MTTDLPTRPLKIAGRRGTRVPARAQIMGWLLLVLVLVLLTVIVIVREYLHDEVDHRVTESVEQEAREFVAFAERGRDPVTGTVLADPGTLLRNYLGHQYPDGDEALIGAWPTAGGLGVVSQEQTESIKTVAHDRAVLQRIVDAPEAHGVLDTAAGPVHWVKVRAETAGGGSAWFVIERHTAAETAEVERSVRVLLLVSALGVVLAALISWVVAGLILAPVRAVRQAAAEITEHDLTRRIPVEGRDDIAALADQFNAMLDRLEDAFRIQRQFVDDAGHELRTPITIVRGNLELIGVDPAERDEVVRLCTDELDRMTRIVNDLLVLAKADRPDFVSPTAVSLAELTSDIDAKVRSLGDRRWVLAEVGEGEFALDGQRITQAVVQLAQNAVQHTEEGSTIRIGSAVGDGTVELWVSDDGPGVDPAEVQKIFERFTHGTGRTGGAGLGLAIVRAIADAHHGRVVVRSTPGTGATFRLELPARTTGDE